MIYTVTFNPSIDYIMFTNGFEIKGLNRATSTYKFAGGKGINVSRVLKTLGVPSTTLGFRWFSWRIYSSNIRRKSN